MKKKIMSFLRIYLVFTVALALIISLTYSALAEFTKSEKAKRVVAAYASAGQSFASDILKQERYHIKTLFVDQDDVELIDGGSDAVTVSTVVSIFNYVQGNPNSYYGKDITYQLSGRLVTREEVDNNGDLEIVVTEYTGAFRNSVLINGVPVYNNGSNYSESFTLTGGDVDIDEFTITFPGQMLRAEDRLYLELIAVPTPKNNEIKNDLYVYIDIAEKPEAVHTGWNIECTDSGTFSDYFGYNWRLSGIGQDTLTLTWDPYTVYLSQACLKYYKNQLETGHESDINDSDIANGKLIIVVDSDVLNSYDLQFFPVVGSAADDWEDVAVTIG